MNIGDIVRIRADVISLDEYEITAKYDRNPVVYDGKARVSVSSFGNFDESMLLLVGSKEDVEQRDLLALRAANRRRLRSRE